MNPQRQVLKSRWGLDPVVVSEMRREVGDDKRWMRRQANSSTEGGDLDSGDDQDEETEETGVTLWDCAQVLWDLLSNPRSSLSVQGKRVIELGAGTGALSVGIARAGAALVVCTDLPCHLKRIRATVRTNGCSTSRSMELTGCNNLGEAGGCGGGMGLGADEDDLEIDPATGQGTGPREAPEGEIGGNVVNVFPLRWGADVSDVLAVANITGGQITRRRRENSPRHSQQAASSQSPLCSGSTPVVELDRGSTSSSTPTLPSTSTTAVAKTYDGLETNGTRVGANSRDGKHVLSAGTDMLVAAHGGSGADSGAGGWGGGGSYDAGRGWGTHRQVPAAVFDMIVLSEVLYWPALDLLQEDTREPLLSTLVALSGDKTRVVLVYKERWPERERGFLDMCRQDFEIERIPLSAADLPSSSSEQPGSDAIRAVQMRRKPPPEA